MQKHLKGKLIFMVDNKKYHLNFERYYLSDQIERVKVFARKTLLVTSAIIWIEPLIFDTFIIEN